MIPTSVPRGPCCHTPASVPPYAPRVADNTKHTPSHSTPVWYTALRRRAIQPNPSDSTLRLQVHYRPPMPKKKPPGRKRPARPPEERVDWLLLQPYSESNVCALLRLISVVKPPRAGQGPAIPHNTLGDRHQPPPPPRPHKANRNRKSLYYRRSHTTYGLDVPPEICGVGNDVCVLYARA